MGRIAEALKRAEQERRVTMAQAVPEHASVPAALPPSTLPSPIDRPALPPEESAPPTLDVADAEDRERLHLVEGLSESLVPFYETSSLVTEQYRSLRTRLLSQNPDYEHRVIAVTSAVPKEGKSVTALNLGCILAEIRHLRVLVVDGDFRRSSLAQMLNQPDGPGLAEVLTGRATYDEVIRSTPIPNLSFIPAGSTKNRSAAELLTEARTRPAFKRMQNDFHYTIVDTPPATTVTDVGIIGQMCSGVIVIVRLHRTHEAAAKRAVRLLQVNNIPILGCMIVGRDSRINRYGYAYGYQYNYYRYHRYYSARDEKDK